MKNFIIILILLGVIYFAAGYVYKAKKNGKKCIGCPYDDTCCRKSGDSYSCGYNKK
ncbi:MAG: FeoB-associated Cys-rich membrane protein [Clostridia bacterium]|nr:FeoB-associated Cys-rich membrane protein [Clostridia bacterium]